MAFLETVQLGKSRILLVLGAVVGLGIVHGKCWGRRRLEFVPMNRYNLRRTALRTGMGLYPTGNVLMTDMAASAGNWFQPDEPNEPNLETSHSLTSLAAVFAS
jgi:hypothetical protein